MADSYAEVDAAIGDSDLRLALEDTLRSYRADEVVLVVPPGEERVRLQEMLVERAESDVPLRVTEIELS